MGENSIRVMSDLVWRVRGKKDPQEGHLGFWLEQLNLLVPLTTGSRRGGAGVLQWTEDSEVSFRHGPEVSVRHVSQMECLWIYKSTVEGDTVIQTCIVAWQRITKTRIWGLLFVLVAHPSSHSFKQVPSWGFAYNFMVAQTWRLFELFSRCSSVPMRIFMLFLAVTASIPSGFLEFVFIAFLHFVLFICLFIWSRVSLCSSACPRTHCVVQTGLKLTKICTACLCLWSAVVKAHATMPSFIVFLKKRKIYSTYCRLLLL